MSILRSRRLWAAAGGATALIAANGQRDVTLRRQEVHLDADVITVLSRLRDRLGAGSDVVAAEGDRIVRRFAGSAGRFEFATVELLEFDDDGISFQHLRGPFAACRERFDLRASEQGSLLIHTGTFSMKGGAWSWLFGVAFVKPAFDAHVRQHMLDLQQEFAADSPPTHEA